MKNTIPAGWRIIHAARGDIERVTHFLARCDTAYFGAPDTTLADMEYEWSRPGFDPTKHAILLLTDSDVLAGYSDIHFDGEEIYISHNTVIHPDFAEGIDCTIFYEIAEEEARKTGGICKIRTISIREESSQILMQSGYSPIQTQYRMVKDISGPLDSPKLQAEYAFLPFNREQDAYEVFEVIENAFRELPHRRGNTFEGWQEHILNRKDFDPTLLWTVRKQGEIAGVGIGFDDPIGGWVRQLAVKKPHRGKGIALAILQKAFLEFRQRGRSTVGLTVDSENATGAPQLYIHAGMKQTEKYVTFVKTLS